MLPPSVPKRCWSGCGFPLLASAFTRWRFTLRGPRGCWHRRPRYGGRSTTDLQPTLPFPSYLGDALQLRFRTGDMFAEHNVTVQVEDEENTELVFPVSLVERAETFDALMNDVAEAIEKGDDPTLALDDHQINEPRERQILGETIAAMKRLHTEGRNTSGPTIPAIWCGLWPCLAARWT